MSETPVYVVHLYNIDTGHTETLGAFPDKQKAIDLANSTDRFASYTEIYVGEWVGKKMKPVYERSV